MRGWGGKKIDMDNYHKKIKIFEALIALSDFTGKTENQIVSLISFLDDKMFQKFKAVVDEVNEFYSLPLKERCEKMGYTYSEEPDGRQIVSTEL